MALNNVYYVVQLTLKVQITISLDEQGSCDYPPKLVHYGYVLKDPYSLLQA